MIYNRSEFERNLDFYLSLPTRRLLSLYKTYRRAKFIGFCSECGEYHYEGDKLEAEKWNMLLTKLKEELDKREHVG